MNLAANASEFKPIIGAGNERRSSVEGTLVGICLVAVAKKIALYDEQNFGLFRLL